VNATSQAHTAGQEESFTCVADHCITCSDEGIPMAVIDLDSQRGLATCADQSGQRGTVDVALVEPVSCGEMLLVHAGTAIAVLREDTPR
jgi:hydrogenase maturation factor